jgi:hypothetical protein
MAAYTILGTMNMNIAGRLENPCSTGPVELITVGYSFYNVGHSAVERKAHRLPFIDVLESYDELTYYCHCRPVQQCDRNSDRTFENHYKHLGERQIIWFGRQDATWRIDFLRCYHAGSHTSALKLVDIIFLNNIS